MDIFRVSARLVRFELHLFADKWLFNRQRPFSAALISPRLQNHNTQNFGVGSVDYTSQQSGAVFNVQKGPQNKFNKKHTRKWLEMVNGCTKRLVILLLVHPANLEQGDDPMPLYPPMLQETIQRRRLHVK